MFLLPMMLLACWPDDETLSSLDFSEIAYQNEHLTPDREVVVSFFDTELACPDGGNTRFAAVYPTDLTEAAPVAIVFHDGAFDYLIDGDVAGAHYYSPGRLERGWAVSAVWATLGLDPVPAASDLGTLPAALANAGIVQLYPANCWGDLWHNEQGLQDNDYSLESFSRNGRTIASWMTQILVDPAAAESRGVQIPVALDTSTLFLVGLGDGGRAVTELLLRDGTPPITGILVDSVPDDLTAYIAPADTFNEIEAGLLRIFTEAGLPDVQDSSLLELDRRDLLPARVGFIWSDGDPRLPLDSIRPTAERLSQRPGAWVLNQRLPQHTSLNRDLSLATAAVDYLLTGTIPDTIPDTTADTGR